MRSNCQYRETQTRKRHRPFVVVPLFTGPIFAAVHPRSRGDTLAGISPPGSPSPNGSSPLSRGRLRHRPFGRCLPDSLQARCAEVSGSWRPEREASSCSASSHRLPAASAALTNHSSRSVRYFRGSAWWDTPPPSTASKAAKISGDDAHLPANRRGDLVGRPREFREPSRCCPRPNHRKFILSALHVTSRPAEGKNHLDYRIVVAHFPSWEVEQMDELRGIRRGPRGGDLRRGVLSGP